MNTPGIAQKLSDNCGLAKPEKEIRMAIQAVAKDGHLYIHRGYSVADAPDDKARFAAYQVHVRAELLFEEAGVAEGTKLPGEVFYALLLDGDIFNDARPNGVSVSVVPFAVRHEAIVRSSQPGARGRFKGVATGRRLFTLDDYRVARAQRSTGDPSGSREDFLSDAARFTLYLEAASRRSATY